MSGVKEAITGAIGTIGRTLGLPDFDPSAGTIFITGGTGVVGYRVATRLLNAGFPTVRVGVLHPDCVDDLNKKGAEVADFSWDRDDTYKTALRGVKTVFFTAPYMEDWAYKFPLFLKECKNAGVKHFVKISFYHASMPGDPFQDVPLVKAHGECDKQLKKSSLIPGMPGMSGMSYTVLAASHFMSNPLVFQGRNLRSDQKPAALYGASGEHGVNYVSPNDIADVAVRALLAPQDHHNKEYTLTGPAAIKEQQVAELLSKHLGKPIMYVDQPLHTFEDEEKYGGDPEWMVRDLVALEKIKASGKEEEALFVTNDIEEICGRKAETFEEYLLAKEHMTVQESATGVAE